MQTYISEIYQSDTTLFKIKVHCHTIKCDILHLFYTRVYLNVIEAFSFRKCNLLRWYTNTMYINTISFYFTHNFMVLKLFFCLHATTIHVVSF